MKAEMSRTRKTFLALFAAAGFACGQDVGFGAIASADGGGFVLEEFVVVADALDEDEPVSEREPEPELGEELPRGLLDDVAVEGEKPLFATPSSTILAGEELQRALKATLGETLAGQPGISSSSYSAGVSRPIIRGLDGFRVAMLLDGLGTLDLSQDSPDHGVLVDTALAESLEIYRGPSSLRFGSGAIGGAVNTVTKLRPTLVPEGDWGGSVSGGYDSQGSGHHVGVGAHAAHGWFAVSVYGGERRAGDISIPGSAWTSQYEEDVRSAIAGLGAEEQEAFLLRNSEGTLANSFHESGTRSVGLSFGSPDTLQLGVSFAQFTSSYGIGYFFDGDLRGISGQTSIDTQLDRFDADLSFTPQGGWGPFSKVLLRAAYGQYEHSENFEDFDVEAGNDFTAIQFDRESWEGRFELFNGTEESILSGVSGVHFATNRLDSKRRVLGVGGTDDAVLRQEVTGLYTTQKLQMNELSLEYGVRAEYSDVSSETINLLEEQASTVSQSITLGWETEKIPHLTNFGVHFTASFSERAPSAIERYAFWENEALGNVIIGGDIAAVFLDDIDGPLGIEESSHREMTVSADWDWGNAVVTGYDTHFDNFIFLESRPDLGFEPTAAYVGREARIRGLEGLVEFSLWEDEAAERSVNWGVSGDWIVGQDLTREQELPRMPAPKVGTTLSYHSPSWDVYLEVRRSLGSGSTPDAPVPESGTDPYTLVNAGVTWSPGWGDEAFELSVRGTNLLNEEIREHTSFRKDTSPQPGIGVSVEARLEF